MNTIVISGYKSFIGQNFLNNYKNKYRIIHYRKDINNQYQFLKFTKKFSFDYFIHFAALSRNKCDLNKNLCQKTNFRGVKLIVDTFNLLKNKPRFIFISSSHVYGNSKYKLKENSVTKPKSLYAKLKLKSENYIKKKYINYSILRLFNVYGKNQPSGYFISDMTDKIKNNQTIKIDKSIRDFVNVNTVSRVINFIIMNDILGIINVGSGRGYSLKSIINQIGVKLKIKPLLIVLNKKTKIVADLKLLKEKGFKFKQNEKNLNI